MNEGESKEGSSKTRKREETGYYYCPECGSVFTLKGMSSHIRNKHDLDKEWDEIKEDLELAPPPEGIQEGEKKEEEQVSAEEISPEEQMKKEAIKYMKDNFPLIPGFPSRSKKKLNFLIRLFKKQKLWESPEKFRRFARKIKSFCPKVKWEALNPILDDIWGIILEWKSQSGGYSPRRREVSQSQPYTPPTRPRSTGSSNQYQGGSQIPANSNQGSWRRQPQQPRQPQQSRPPSRKDRALMKRLNTLEKTVRQLAGALKKDKNKIPVVIGDQKVKMDPEMALPYLLQQQGGTVESKYEERIKDLREELRDAKENLRQEKVSDLKERIDDLQESLSSKPDEEKLVREAAKRFKTGRTPYDLMDKGMKMLDERTGQILSKITLPAPPQQGPPQLGKQKTEKRAEKMKKQIKQGREEKKLENEFLETVE